MMRPDQNIVRGWRGMGNWKNHLGNRTTVAHDYLGFAEVGGQRRAKWAA